MDGMQNNFIANMHGPEFLAFYGIVSLAVIVIGWLMINSADRTRGADVPELPDKPDPYAIAYLRGGAREVIRLAVFNLIRRGYFTTDFASSSRATDERRIQQSPSAPSLKELTRIERAVHDFAGGESRPKKFFDDQLVSVIELLSAETKQNLLEQRLLRSGRARTMAIGVMFLGTSAILGLGGYKLVVALSRGKYNVGLLITIGIAAAVLHAVVTRPRRISNLGRRYLKRLQSAFKNTKSKLARAVIDPADATPAIAVGLFGLVALGSTSMSDVNTMFRRSSNQSSFFSCASCGASCGSSCGGGGCGGGGCGGCGGS